MSRGIQFPRVSSTEVDTVLHDHFLVADFLKSEIGLKAIKMYLKTQFVLVWEGHLFSLSIIRVKKFEKSLIIMLQ